MGREAPEGATIDPVDAVRWVMARQLRLPPEELSDDLDLAVDLGLDEESAMIMVEAVGECLDVRFPDDFLDGVHTYADLTSAVRVAVGI